MGTYDRLLPSSGQFISTYAGAPIEETAALGETLTQNFERGMQGVSAYNVMRNNVSVLDKDKDLKNKIFDDSYKGLEAYAERGDYENAIPAIMNATTMVSGNQELKSAMASKKATDTFVADIQDSDAEQWQKDLAITRLGGYQGAAAGDSVSKYMQMPTQSVDIRKQMQDAAAKVKPYDEIQEEVWNEKIGQYEIQTITKYSPEEIDAAMATAVNNPETQAYIAELREAEAAGIIPQGSVDESLAQYRMSVGAAADTETFKMTYKDRADGGGGAGGAGGGQGGSLNILGPQNQEGVDYIKPGEDIEFDWVDTFEERAKMREDINNNPGGWFKSIGQSMNAMWNDIPTDEEIAEFNKVSDSAQNFNDLSDTQWEAKTSEEREEIIKDYINVGGKYQNNISVTNFNVADEIAQGNLASTGGNWSQARQGEEIAKNVQRNHQSMAIYDLSEQELVKVGKEPEDLAKAFAGEKGYSYTILGDADSRNSYAAATDNADLASSYVMLVNTPEGEKRYLVGKGEKYQRNNSAAMNGYNKMSRKVSNREYDSKVSEIFNQFPAPSYTDNYSDENGVSFEGERSKKNPNILIIKDLKTSKGNVNLEQFAKQINAGAGADVVEYDPDTGELYGLNDNMLAQIVLSMGLTK